MASVANKETKVTEAFISVIFLVIDTNGLIVQIDEESKELLRSNFDYEAFPGNDFLDFISSRCTSFNRYSKFNLLNGNQINCEVNLFEAGKKASFCITPVLIKEKISTITVKCKIYSISPSVFYQEEKEEPTEEEFPVLRIDVNELSVRGFNNKLISMLGISPRELIKLNLSDIVAKPIPTSKELLSNQVKELVLLGINGTVKYVEPRVHMPEMDGIYVDIELKPITQSEYLSRTLKENEGKYRGIISALTEGIVIHDKRGMITSCNSAAQSILGLSFDQMVGKDSIDPLWRTVKEDGSPFPGEEHPAMITLATGKPQHQIIMGVYLPDGSITWIMINSEPIFDNEDKLSGAVASFTDITDIKQKELKLDLLAVVAKKTTNSVIITDTDHRIQWVNDSFSLLTGYTLDEVVGRNPKFLQGPETNRDTIRQIRESLNGKKPIKTEIYNYGKNGKGFWIEMDIQPVFNKQGNIAHFVGIQTDITRRKENENMLRQQNERLTKTNAELDHFVYRASHDLRAPIASNLGLISLMKKENLSGNLKVYVDMLKKSMHKLDSLLGNIFYYDQNNHKDLIVDRIDFATMIETVLFQHDPQRKFRNIIFHVDIDTHLELFSDAERVEVILFHLIDNAVKYQNPDSPEHHIWVSAQSAKNGCLMTVKDNGIGIDEMYLNHIFEMFFRASEKSNGSGLGLYLVKEIVTKLGGNIKVQSRKRMGTEFSILIPDLRN